MTDLKLPSAGLLKVHATLAKILHASGAAKTIEKKLEDLDTTAVLANDGSSDIAGMLAMTSIGILGSRVGNVQERRNSADENTKPAHIPPTGKSTRDLQREN